MSIEDNVHQRELAESLAREIGQLAISELQSRGLSPRGVTEFWNLMYTGIRMRSTQGQADELALRELEQLKSSQPKPKYAGDAQLTGDAASAVALADEIDEVAGELIDDGDASEDCHEFAASVREKANSIAGTIRKTKRCSEKQLTAITNMHGGLMRFRDRSEVGAREREPRDYKDGQPRDWRRETHSQFSEPAPKGPRAPVKFPEEDPPW